MIDRKTFFNVVKSNALEICNFLKIPAIEKYNNRLRWPTSADVNVVTVKTVLRIMKVVPITDNHTINQDVDYESDASSSIHSQRDHNDDKKDSAVNKINRKQSNFAKHGGTTAASKLMQRRQEIREKVVKEVLDNILPDIGAYDIDGTTRVRSSNNNSSFLAFIIKWLKILGCLELDLHDAVLTGSLPRVKGSVEKITNLRKKLEKKKKRERYVDASNINSAKYNSMNANREEDGDSEQELSEREIVENKILGMLNQYDGLGRTPLSLAAKLGDPEIVMTLIDNGAHPDIIDETTGRTPLFFAVLNKFVDITRVLIESRATVNIMDFKCITPLMIAAHNNDAQICRMLIQARAELDLQDENGWTALHYAAVANAEEALVVLLEEGADRDIKDAHKRKAINLAKFKKNGNCVAILSAKKWLFR